MISEQIIESHSSYLSFVDSKSIPDSDYWSKEISCRNLDSVLNWKALISNFAIS